LRIFRQNPPVIGHISGAYRAVFRAIGHISGAYRTVFRAIGHISEAYRTVFRAIGHVRWVVEKKMKIFFLGRSMVLGG
jgi:hypothetical protein